LFSFVTQSNAPIASQRCHNTRALDLSTYFIDDPQIVLGKLLNPLVFSYTNQLKIVNLQDNKEPDSLSTIVPHIHTQCKEKQVSEKP